MCLWQAPELLLRWFLIMVLLPFWAVAMCLITALAWHRQRPPKGEPLSMEDIDACSGSSEIQNEHDSFAVEFRTGCASYVKAYDRLTDALDGGLGRPPGRRQNLVGSRPERARP